MDIFIPVMYESMGISNIKRCNIIMASKYSDYMTLSTSTLVYM